MIKFDYQSYLDNFLLDPKLNQTPILNNLIVFELNHNQIILLVDFVSMMITKVLKQMI